MEVEKRSSKGGFLHLFDWNIKSRKKLFSSKSEVPGSSKQVKDNFNQQAHSKFQKVNDYRFDVDAKQNYDCHSTSSVSGDEAYGQRPPGVVARLMGLDSMPTSQGSEYYQAAPSPYSHSYRDSHYPRAPDGFKKEHRIVVYEDIRNKLDGFTMNPVEMRLLKLQNLPIERFQSETLPPKSAKPISVTQHRMLSPIKSRGFIPPKNAEYIIEASSRIIHQSPRSTIKNKMQKCGSSSVPLRIRDLREKMDASQKPLRVGEVSQRIRYHNSVRDMRRQPTERVEDLQEGTPPVWVSEASKLDVSRGKGKERSGSLAVQAKNNIQKREELAPIANNRTTVIPKECNEGKSGRKRSNAERSVEKRKVSKPSNVLRQNNQKQNGSSNKDEESPKPSISYPKDRKSSSSNDSSRPTKTVKNIVVNNRNSSGAARFMATDMGKELSSSRRKMHSRKEMPVNEDIRSYGTVSNSILNSKDEKSVKCNVTIEGCTEWDGVEKRNGTDVISFTFTSPIKKLVSESTSLTQITENKIFSLISDSCDIETLPKSSISRPLGLNIFGGDALGILLDEKLKELTSIVESSGQDLNEMGSISSTANTSASSDLQNIIPAEQSRFKFNPTKEKTDVQCDFVCSPLVALQPNTEKWQLSKDIEEDLNGIYIGHDREFNSQYPSPTSSLESSFSVDSNSLSDNIESFNGNGTKNHFAGSHEVRGRNSSITLSVEEEDAELLDSASSVSICSRNKQSRIAFICADIKGSTYWELEYIRDIIRNADLTTKIESFSTKAVPADLFDTLESQQKYRFDKSVRESKPNRRVLFDCVVECLEFKNKESFGGSFQNWARWNMLVERKEWLAEEVYREVSCWTEMEDLMVDEVVERDMSTRHGKWTEFGREELEEGIEVELGILTSLVEELVFDIWLS
ncbi:hypothetical protein DM860_007435 [Cuscuta australis]|uniref:DUF4378 domain-containing protein n=1 Tax=Cuscuta australis TaxID=267555 RepID=A0A328E3Z2_9ASTE|nr:hypothetical protein DM860_007435 [Cuscuta australis]